MFSTILIAKVTWMTYLFTYYVFATPFSTWHALWEQGLIVLVHLHNCSIYNRAFHKVDDR